MPANRVQHLLPLPPLLVAHGLPCTGKSVLIKAFLEASALPHVIVNCRECITGRHLLERTVAGCLAALDAIGDGEIDRRPYSRTENLSSLVVNLQKMVDGRRESLVVVFDGIDAQREAPPTLLPALARFGELV